LFQIHFDFSAGSVFPFEKNTQTDSVMRDILFISSYRKNMKQE